MSCRLNSICHRSILDVLGLSNSGLVPLFLVDHKWLIRYRIQVYIVEIDNDFICMTKQCSHLFKWDSLGLWKDKDNPDYASSRQCGENLAKYVS